MKTITVKGIGTGSARPDWIVITLSLESLDPNYEKMTELSADKSEALTLCLKEVGFDPASIKTTAYQVEMRYENRKEKDGSFSRVFQGYACSHQLKLEFDFESRKLGKTLQAIAGCAAKPEWNIQFTVKNPDAICEEVLRSASENARKKAEILCNASGMKLGNLLSVEDAMERNRLVSPTRYAVAEDCMAAPLRMSARTVDFVPDDVSVKETVLFVWEMEEGPSCGR